MPNISENGIFYRQANRRAYYIYILYGSELRGITQDNKSRLAVMSKNDAKYLSSVLISRYLELAGIRAHTLSNKPHNANCSAMICQCMGPFDALCKCLTNVLKIFCTTKTIAQHVAQYFLADG